MNALSLALASILFALVMVYFVFQYTASLTLGGM